MYKQYVALCTLVIISLISGCSDNDHTDNAKHYPTKNLQIICPWGAGGGTDRISRFFAEQLKQQLGKNCVVVNRTGGSGAVGHKAGANANADGHTIAMITAELSTMHQLDITDITYQDYRPLLQINGDPAAILIGKNSPYRTLVDFLDAVRESPGKLKMSGTAAGGTWDLARAGLFKEVGLSKDDVIWVPTKGSAESVQNLLGGHLDAVCCSLPEAALQLRAGDIRGLAVMADHRDTMFPEIPTALEQDVNWTSVGWRGFATQKEVPSEIATILQKHLLQIAESEDYKQFMADQGFTIDIKSGEEFREFLQQQDQQWKSVLEYYVTQ
ncbi:MAG: hypothetical protein CMJ76_06320 [Planctomycetaceae bacterium]|mgnify:CR=1 FL=1|nr:hypothetical protein [Planctomycetaceae bacterium]|tara:strand:- start:1614 stop:2594 length:981 start_codon:yes stop_codon:yes gene_type:complete